MSFTISHLYSSIFTTLLLILPVALLLPLLLSYCFSPLRHIPGPTTTLLSPFPLIYQEFTRNRRAYIHSLHKAYGPVVRLSPNEVSFTSVSALREIYTSEGAGWDKTEFYDLFRQFGERYVHFDFILIFCFDCDFDGFDLDLRVE